MDSGIFKGDEINIAATKFCNSLQFHYTMRRSFQSNEILVI